MKKGKSLRQLAEELQISPAYLSMILSGQRNPNSQLRNKLCSLGVLTSEAKIGLGSKHSTAELHPQRRIHFSPKTYDCKESVPAQQSFRLPEGMLSEALSQETNRSKIGKTNYEYKGRLFIWNGEWLTAWRN